MKMLTQEKIKHINVLKENKELTVDDLSTKALNNLKKALEGYTVESEKIITETFDAEGNLTGTKVQTKKKNIFMDPKDTIGILSRINSDFKPSYTKEKDDNKENNDIDLSSYT